MSKDAARHEPLGETLTKTTGGRGAPAGHARRDRPEAPSAAESGGGRHPDLRGRWGRAWRRPLGSGSAVSYARTPRAGSLALLVHTETGHAARGRSTVTSDARSGEHAVTRQDAVRAAAGGGTRHGTRGTELAPRLTRRSLRPRGHRASAGRGGPAGRAGGGGGQPRERASGSASRSLSRPCTCQARQVTGLNAEVLTYV